VITLSLLHPVKQTPVQVWSFPSESVVRIGRSNDNQVVLYSAVVSRYHVELRQSGKTWEVVNVGTNGTYMDGKRVTQMPIVDGSIIRLARSGPNIQINLGTVRNDLANAAMAAQPVKLPEEMPLTSNEPPE
jgi:eukaryotic-like serine/threonine-protein kinase